MSHISQSDMYVVVTVTLTSVKSVKLMCGGGLALSWKGKVNCLPSVGVAMVVVRLERGRTGGERDYQCLLHCMVTK